MDTLDRESLKSLTRQFGFPCVSIYMSTHRAGGEKEQDPIRFRNLLDQASALLANEGLRGPDAESLLAPLRRTQDDSSFWRAAADGLAAFVSHGTNVVLRLDTSFPEMAVVSERFTVRPLVPAIHTDLRFWLLALSKNRVRLYSANHQSIDEVPIPGAPGTFKEAMKYEDAGHGFQFHPESAASPAGARGTSVYYGGGGLPDAEKDQVERFLRMVERAVEDVLRNSGEPLVLAGVEYELALYRSLNSYPHLAEAALVGNYDEVSVSQLHAEGREAIAPHFAGRVAADLAELDQKAASAIVSEDLREIVTAAHAGRVRTLFVDDATSVWGRYDASTGRVDVHAKPAPGDWDLAELATSETLLHGGDVHVLRADQIPAGPTPAPPAAIMRY